MLEYFVVVHFELFSDLFSTVVSGLIVICPKESWNYAIMRARDFAHNWRDSAYTWANTA